MSKVRLLACVVAVFLSACDGGGKGGGESRFLLLSFQESLRDNIPRNRILLFVFSEPVAPNQNLAERLKIKNVQAGDPANFSLAQGTYVVSAERVAFVPRLPTKEDRSDAGLRANANYHVFLKGGADALTSAGNRKLALPQEFIFDTNEYFDDLVPDQPPRVLSLIARDTSSGQEFDMSRLVPDPKELAELDNDTLVQADRILEPGGGGAPDYATPWEFEVRVSEPLDPKTVFHDAFELLEIRHDALKDADSAIPGELGDPVSYKVPFDAKLIQSMGPQGQIDVVVRITLVQPLLDDARYRLSLSGQVLGLDFRKAFVGDNGLTGDGQTIPEAGGLGYTTEFLVFDRPAIQGARALTYDRVLDQILPETGQTALDPSLYNNALYDEVGEPGRAVGAGGGGDFEFGNGELGVMVVTNGQTLTLDTGDTPNAPSSNPFTVIDVDPDDEYSNLGAPTPNTRTFETLLPTDFPFESLTVLPAGTLIIVGVNPCRVLVENSADIQGTINASGGSGVGGGTTTAIPGGTPGPAGFAGGGNKRPDKSCRVGSTGVGTGDCSSFDKWLQLCAAAQPAFPYTEKGEGPGRGNAGGEAYPMWAWPTGTGILGSVSGTGGGGGSHATMGEPGEDRLNEGADVGTAGPACAGGATSSGTPIVAPPTPPAINIPNAGVIGVRGVPGPTYGDREGDIYKIGGSGGGAGGSIHTHLTANGATTSTGGTGGGGGGHFELNAAAGIRVTGRITVAGGAGGKGVIQKNTTLPQGGVENSGWETISGSAGGGAGGTLRLISTADIVLGGVDVLDARGGAGGGRPDNPVNPAITDCKSCNAGGDGGKGFIFLVDVDGGIQGLPPSEHGFNDDFEYGVLTTRRATVVAITELFRIPAADPEFLPLIPIEVVGYLTSGQRIRVFASSAKADEDDPRQPDLTTEIPGVEMALISITGVTITGDMSDLNPTGQPDRDTFVRISAEFEYDSLTAAATPSAMDEVTVHFRFNG